MSNLWLERKYISLLAPRIQKFRWKSPNLANGRCPICFDSLYNPKKMRFFIYQKDAEWRVHCHNCGLHKPFKKFLKEFDIQLFSQMSLEQFSETQERDLSEFKTEVVFDSKSAWQQFRKLKKISSLPIDHSAQVYVKKRKIPNEWHAEFKWVDQFMLWTNDLVPGKFDEDALKYDTGRIVIPFYDKGRYLFAVQGRALTDLTGAKYISILLDGSRPLLWGLDRLDTKKPIYAFEGVLDAIFIPNAMAICGSNFVSLLKTVENPIVVYDNEPHSTETKKKIEAAINQGLRVVIWPDNIQQKDVNSMIIAGYGINHISWIMKNNIFDGLSAKIRLNEWSKR